MCKYDYAGTKRHVRYRIGEPDTPAVVNEILEYLQDMWNLSSNEVPDCVVVNWYDASKGIDWHADDEYLFKDEEQPTEILSLSLGADGVFCVRPRRGTNTSSICDSAHLHSSLCMSVKKSSSRQLMCTCLVS